MLEIVAAKRNTTVLILLLALMALHLGGCGKSPEQRGSKSAPSPAARPPNILLISIDTLRPDHLGCYGYARQTSPRIDQVAADGVVFENAFSTTSWTLPSHCALFTGLPDEVHGCTDGSLRLSESYPTMAERLKALGYTTAGFFSGPFVAPLYGFGRGFGQYTDCTSYEEQAQSVLAGRPSTSQPVDFHKRNGDINNPRTYQRVHRWLTENHSQPFFLFVHFFDVHADYIPPAPYDTKFDPDYTGTITGRDYMKNPAINKDLPKRDIEHLIALYDGEIAWTDMHVGMVLDDLDALHLRESTIVVIVSDHGEEFFEHGDKEHYRTLFDEVTHVALLIRYPGAVPAGHRQPEQVRLFDVMATVFELAGLPAPEKTMGQSLVPLLHDQPLTEDNLVVGELMSNGYMLRAFRRPDRKLIVDIKNGTSITFDLAADSGEQHPLAPGQNPALVERVLADAQAGMRWVEQGRQALDILPVAPQGIPDELRKQLISLGYLGGETQPTSEHSPP